MNSIRCLLLLAFTLLASAQINDVDFVYVYHTPACGQISEAISAKGYYLNRCTPAGADWVTPIFENGGITFYHFNEQTCMFGATFSDSYTLGICVDDKRIGPVNELPRFNVSTDQSKTFFKEDTCLTPDHIEITYNSPNCDGVAAPEPYEKPDRIDCKATSYNLYVSEGRCQNFRMPAFRIYASFVPTGKVMTSVGFDGSCQPSPYLYFYTLDTCIKRGQFYTKATYSQDHVDLIFYEDSSCCNVLLTCAVEATLEGQFYQFNPLTDSVAYYGCDSDVVRISSGASTSTCSFGYPYSTDVPSCEPVSENGPTIVDCLSINFLAGSPSNGSDCPTEPPKTEPPSISRPFQVPKGMKAFQLFQSEGCNGDSSFIVAFNDTCFPYGVNNYAKFTVSDDDTIGQISFYANDDVTCCGITKSQDFSVGKCSSNFVALSSSDPVPYLVDKYVVTYVFSDQQCKVFGGIFINPQGYNGGCDVIPAEDQPPKLDCVGGNRAKTICSNIDLSWASPEQVNCSEMITTQPPTPNPSSRPFVLPRGMTAFAYYYDLQCQSPTGDVRIYIHNLCHYDYRMNKYTQFNLTQNGSGVLGVWTTSQDCSGLPNDLQYFGMGQCNGGTLVLPSGNTISYDLGVNTVEYDFSDSECANLNGIYIRNDGSVFCSTFPPLDQPTEFSCRYSQTGYYSDVTCQNMKLDYSKRDFPLPEGTILFSRFSQDQCKDLLHRQIVVNGSCFHDDNESTYMRIVFVGDDVEIHRYSSINQNCCGNPDSVEKADGKQCNGMLSFSRSTFSVEIAKESFMYTFSDGDCRNLTKIDFVDSQGCDFVPQGNTPPEKLNCSPEGSVSTAFESCSNIKLDFELSTYVECQALTTLPPTTQAVTTIPPKITTHVPETTKAPISTESPVTTKSPSSSSSSSSSSTRSSSSKSASSSYVKPSNSGPETLPPTQSRPSGMIQIQSFANSDCTGSLRTVEGYYNGSCVPQNSRYLRVTVFGGLVQYRVFNDSNCCGFPIDTESIDFTVGQCKFSHQVLDLSSPVSFNKNADTITYFFKNDRCSLGYNFRIQYGVTPNCETGNPCIQASGNTFSRGSCDDFQTFVPVKPNECSINPSEGDSGITEAPAPTKAKDVVLPGVPSSETRAQMEIVGQVKERMPKDWLLMD